MSQALWMRYALATPADLSFAALDELLRVWDETYGPPPTALVVGPDDLLAARLAVAKQGFPLEIVIDPDAGEDDWRLENRR